MFPSRGYPDAGGGGSALPGSISLAALGEAVWRRRMWIAVPVAAAGLIAAVWLWSEAPLYRSQTRVLIESQETAFTRPERSAAEARVLDQEQIRSQEQIILSADLGRDVIRRVGLGSYPEFAPGGTGLVPRLLALAGITRDPSRLTAEQRVMEAFHRRLTVYRVAESRVIAIEFSSTDPELAARVANEVAATYIETQRAARRDSTIEASAWLGAQIDTLRRRVDDAERVVERFRREHGLFPAQRASGTGDEIRSLSEQELGELTTQLATARAERSDAQARARMIRAMLDAGGELDSSDVLGAPVIQNLQEQRARQEALLAELSSSLGPRHPRIREISAEIAALGREIRAEAVKIVRALENDVRVATEREEQLLASLDALKGRAADVNEHEVEMRALEREARAQRDLLESMMARFSEASVRDTLAALPAEARVISLALPALEPYYPRRVPTLLAIVIATGFVAGGLVVTLELMRQMAAAAQAAAGPVQMPRQQTVGREAATAGPAGRAGPLAAVARAVVASAGRRPVALVTAVRRRDGVGHLALRLSREIAVDGHSVVLVDASFGDGPDLPGASRGGLSELIAGKVAFDTAIVRDPVSRVHVIASGGEAEDPLRLVASARMELVLEALSQTYDAVLVLAPAINRSAEARLLARRSGFAVLVTSAGDVGPATDRARLRLIDAGIGEVAELALDDSGDERLPDDDSVHAA